MKQATTAQRLKQIIADRHLTQTEVLERCNRVCRRNGEKELGKSAISQYVNGKVVPKQDKIYIIAEALDVSEAWLLGYDVPMEREAPTAPEAPAPGSSASGWNVEYPSGVALHTARDPRPGEVASGLSETDIFRIAQKVKNLNDRSLPYANLNPSEAQLVENYRLLYPRQRLKVDSYIAKLLDGNDKDGE